MATLHEQKRKKSKKIEKTNKIKIKEIKRSLERRKYI